MKPIRVCHISTVHDPADRRIISCECRSLVNAGYDVHVVNTGSVDEVRDGLHMHGIGRARNRAARLLIKPWVALRAARQTRADIYHFHDPELLPMGFLIRWLWRRPVVYDVHEAVHRDILSKPWLPRWSRRPVSFLYRLIERALTPGMGIVLANDGSASDYSPSAVVVRNFPPIDEIDIGPAPAPLSRRAAPPLLVYVGRVSEDRGALLYLDLARELKHRGRDFRLKIVGPPRSPEFGRQLQERVAQADLGDCVELTGLLPYSEAMAQVAQAAIGLCLLMPEPNYMVCLATKILEYMLMGTPVLASDFEHWRPFVEGERAGLTANPLDFPAVVDACERMLSDQEELQAMGERGAAAVRTKYLWPHEFEKLDRCYKRLLAGEATRASAAAL